MNRCSTINNNDDTSINDGKNDMRKDFAVPGSHDRTTTYTVSSQSLDSCGFLFTFLRVFLLSLIRILYIEILLYGLRGIGNVGLGNEILPWKYFSRGISF